MRALQQIARIALNLLLKLLRLILAAELQLLDLTLLLSSRLVEDLVLRLELELTTELAVVQLLLAYRIGQHADLANATGRTCGGCLVQLEANKRMRNGRKRDEGTLPGCLPCVVQADVKIRALLLSLEQVAIDPVLRTTLCRRYLTQSAEQEQRNEP